MAWNGFGYEGSAAMAMALADNTSLLTLDLSNNRIHTPALFELIKGIERNKTLTILKVCSSLLYACHLIRSFTRILIVQSLLNNKPLNCRLYYQ